ncbi:hypothetical protein B0H17DRAFT_1011856 [Mycena rosella]|uniref:F-box domain-containing protein n=1 Tax=Mycena rosella TaxID=1033263 RepID=A0AAD7GDN8_MYCRO|nr:hypothetical protein B0H17DRAFT_1011856 [Mycena rosella]
MFLSNSPFTDRLDTNYVPSDGEMDQLRLLLAEPMEKLARVEAAILELKMTRQALKAAIEPHKALMAPLRPILGEIFVACLPTTHNALLDPDDAPLLLGCICRHWRSVAYATPLLWSSLHIPSLMPIWDWEVPKISVARSVEHKLERIVGA